MQRGHNLLGKTFERLVVVGRAKSRKGYAVWTCVCTCGKTVEVRAVSLRKGHTKSCGCYMLDAVKIRARTHGATLIPELKRTYKIWSGIKQRCRPGNNKWRHLYYEKGIRMSQKWEQSFEAFLEDLGVCPEGFSIERLDSAKNYEPENCKWASAKEQSRNTTRNRRYVVNGEVLCVAELAERFAIPRKTLMGRLNYGYSIEEALELVYVPSFKVRYNPRMDIKKPT